MAKTTKQHLLQWILNDPVNVVDTLITLSGHLSTGVKNALITQIRDDLKAKNAEERARYNDAEADSFDIT